MHFIRLAIDWLRSKLTFALKEKFYSDDSPYVSTLVLICFLTIIPVFQNGIFGIAALFVDLPNFTFDIAGQKYVANFETWHFTSFFMHWQVGVANGLLILLLVILTKRWRFLVGLLPLIFLAIPFFRTTGYVEHAYALSSLAVVFILLWRGPLFSNPFALGLALFILELVLPWLGFSPKIYSLIFIKYDLYPVNALTMLALFVLFRFVRRVYQDNIEDLKLEGWLAFRSLLWKTFKIWFPMLIVFVIFTAANIAVRFWVFEPYIIEKIDLLTEATRHDDQLIKAEKTSSLTRKQRKLLVAQYMHGIVYSALPEKKRSLEINFALQNYVDAGNDNFDASAQVILDRYQKQAGTNLDSAADYAEQQFPLRFPGTHTSSCRWFSPDIGCLIMNGVKSMINSGYVNAKNHMIAEIRKAVDQIKKTGGDQKAAFQKELKKIVTKYSKKIKHSIILTAQGVELAGVLSQIYAIMILIKSFLVVAARVRFNTNSIGPNGTGRSRAAQGRVFKSARRPSSLRLSKNGPKQLYFVNSVIAANVIDRWRIPQPFSSILARLRTGRYWLNLIDFEDKNQGAGSLVAVDQPAEIVMWKINKGKEVYVDLNHVIGFSRGCELGRRISFRMSSLVFGRFIFRTIKGPGRLYIRSDAPAYIGNSTESLSIMPPSSLVAFSSNAEFNIVSSLTKTDVFLSGYKIRKIRRQNHLVVYDSGEARRLKAGSGIWQLARTFILPF